MEVRNYLKNRGVKMANNKLEIINNLGDILISSGKKLIYIPDYIKSNAKTTRIPILKRQFEELIKFDNRFTGVRTSEIFHLKPFELKRMPKINGYWMSHIAIN